MHRRCPHSHFYGITRLDGWKWIIGERGFANIVSCPGSQVRGMLYALHADDEAMLDVNEGVPWAYQKRIMTVTVCGADTEEKQEQEKEEERKKIHGARRHKNEVEEVNTTTGDGVVPVHALVYVDERKGEGAIREEYVYRMNRGIEDAIAKGIPGWWVERYLRPYIPADTGAGLNLEGEG